MWVVNQALRRRHTFLVAALLILILGGIAVQRAPKDIFPEIDIPVVTVVWSYPVLSAQDLEQQITF